MNHLVRLVRDDLQETRTFGTLRWDGRLLGQTLEDKDRFLENGGEKVYGQTAIPRGTYTLSLSYSNRFGKVMPIVHDVPGFDGVRIHGGNTEVDTFGCPLLGRVRTVDRIHDCAAANDYLILLLQNAEDMGESVKLEVV